MNIYYAVDLLVVLVTIAVAKLTEKYFTDLNACAMLDTSEKGNAKARLEAESKIGIPDMSGVVCIFESPKAVVVSVH